MNRLFSKSIVLFCALPILIAATYASKGLRFHTNLSAAKQLAATEGKLYLVDFTAQWCLPCQWMEETTFSDNRVVNYMQENYVAVKIDIDDFDGFAWKQIYDIKALPSILIFNSKGELLEQYTGSHAPSGLLKILEEHNQPKNRIKPGPSNLAVSSTPVTNNTSATFTPAAPEVTNTPTTTTTAKPKKRNNAEHTKPIISKPRLSSTKPIDYDNVPDATPTPSPIPRKKPIKKHKITKPIPNSAPVVVTPAATSPEVMTDEGLYKFTVTRQPREGFSVQVGVFAEYGNVLQEVEKLERKFNNPILVQISKSDTKTVYKVLIGSFNDYTTASAFKEAVIATGSEGMVKDLTTL